MDDTWNHSNTSLCSPTCSVFVRRNKSVLFTLFPWQQLLLCYIWCHPSLQFILKLSAPENHSKHEHSFSMQRCCTVPAFLRGWRLKNCVLIKPVSFMQPWIHLRKSFLKSLDSSCCILWWTSLSKCRNFHFSNCELWRRLSCSYLFQHWSSFANHSRAF